MSQPLPDPPASPAPASHLGDFFVDRGLVEPPGRRPGAVIAAGVAMLVFAGIIALQLVVEWTTAIVIEGEALDRFLEILRFQWEPALVAIAVTLVVLAVFVMCGGHRARFAAIATMGGLLIEQMTTLLVAVADVTVFDGDPLLIFPSQAIHVLGLGLAITAVGLLVTSTSTRWFDRRQLTRSPKSAAITRPPVLVAAVVGLTALALYRAFDYVSYMSTATADEYFTHAELLVLTSLYELPPLITLVVAVVGLSFGSGLARVAAYVAAGSYCYEAANNLVDIVRRLVLGPYFDDLSDWYLLKLLLTVTVTVASLIALSRPRTVAWFRSRRGDALEPAAKG